ncbi:MAG: MerR family transcriptional regulator [Elusimicrobiota bacterium]
MTERKNYFTIREISKLTGIKPHTIRYWEEKLKIIKPIRLPSLHRRYTKKDIETILEIKDLLYLKGYSIKGIRKILGKNIVENHQKKSDSKYIDILKDINIEIKKILEELEK